MVMGLTYMDNKGMVLDNQVGAPWRSRTDYMGEGKEVLSDGGTTITWTISTEVVDDGIKFPMEMGGETVTIERNHGQRLRAGGR